MGADIPFLLFFGIGVRLEVQCYGTILIGDFFGHFRGIGVGVPVVDLVAPGSYNMFGDTFYLFYNPCGQYKIFGCLLIVSHGIWGCTFGLFRVTKVVYAGNWVGATNILDQVVSSGNVYS